VSKNQWLKTTNLEVRLKWLILKLEEEESRGLKSVLSKASLLQLEKALREEQGQDMHTGLENVQPVQKSKDQKIHTALEP